MSRSHRRHSHTLLEVNINQEYTCNSCNTLGLGRAFKCTASRCSYLTHHYCATCPTVLGSYMHPHSLSLTQVKPGPRGDPRIFCDMCSDLVTGQCYACLRCGFYVHPLCTTFPYQLIHTSHSHHTLTLKYANNANLNFCLACGDRCLKWRYSCEQCDLHVHADCLPDWTTSSRPVNLVAPSSSRSMNQPGSCGYGPSFPVAPNNYFNQGQSYPPSFACAPSNNFNHPSFPVAPNNYFNQGQSYLPSFPIAPNNYFDQGQSYLPSFACAPSNNFNQGQSSGSGRRRKKIYSILANVAVNAVVGSLIGLPVFNPFGG